MKKWIAAALLLVMLIPAASAARITNYDAEAEIFDSLVKEKLLIFVDYQGESSMELFLPPAVKDLVAKVNGAPVICEQEEILGFTKVTCPVTPATITGGADYFIDLNFETSFPIVSLDDRKLFSQDFIFGDSFVEKFNFRLKLPERAVIPEPTGQFVSPEPTRIYSDGRKIILSYEAFEIDKSDVTAIYEPAKASSIPLLLAIASLIAIAVGVLLLKAAKKIKQETKEKAKEVAKEVTEEATEKIAEEVKKRVKEKVQEKEEKLYLLPDEKGIIHILKEVGKPIRQRDIEKQITFSKAKLSRVLRGLEERGIIKRIPRGNTNLIELLKK